MGKTAPAGRPARPAWAVFTVVLLAAARLSAAGPLTGTVHTAAGGVISGAEVVVHGGRPDQRARTDGHGAFTIADVTLPAVLDVTADGFEGAHPTVTASPVEVTLNPAALAESVVVNATRAPAWRDPSTGDTVLSATDLATLPAVTLDESLRAVSGFSLYRRSSAVSANPTTDGVTMRGLSASGSSRALIVLDGIPLNDGFGGWVTWTRLPTEAVGQVDVDRGTAGDAYGSDALGGLIRITTPALDHAGATVGGDVGSMGVAGLDLSGGFQRGRLSFFGASSGFRTDGSIPTAPEARGPIDIATNANWENGFGRMEAAVAPDQHVTVEGWGGTDDRGNGTPLQVNHMTGGTVAASYSGVFGDTTLTARASDSPNSFYQTFSTVNAARTAETLSATQQADTTTSRAVVELGRTLPKAFAIVRGTFSRADGTFTNTTATTHLDDALTDDVEGLSAEGGWTPTGNLTLDAGVRHEWRAAPTTGSATDTATVGHLGAVWQISGPVSFRATASTSQRWPTLNELVRNFQQGNVLTLANPDLVAEHAQSVDAGIFVSRRAWLVSVGGFRSVVDNAVENVTQPAGTVPGFSGIVRERENAGQAHATGLELDGEVKPVPRLRLRASTTWLSTVLEDSPELALDGNKLPQVPRLSASVSGDVLLPRALDGSVVWHAVSSQFDDDRNQFLIAPAYQLDLRLAGPFGTLRSTTWNVVVENALNARIETGRSSATLVTVAAGRAIRVGVVWRK